VHKEREISQRKTLINRITRSDDVIDHVGRRSPIDNEAQLGYVAVVGMAVAVPVATVVCMFKSSRHVADLMRHIVETSQKTYGIFK
jgi:hypothetical protein